jgi:hypothetical protein
MQEEGTPRTVRDMPAPSARNWSASCMASSLHKAARASCLGCTLKMMPTAAPADGIPHTRRGCMQKQT